MIRKISILFFLVGISFNSISQIVWQNDFENALKLAYQTGKNVVVECYHPECQHCMVLNKNLEDPTLVNYFNENYTNLKIDLTNLSQVDLLEKNNIRLTNYPIFLFFDKSGKFIYFIEPAETPEKIFAQFENERGNTCEDCELNLESTLTEKVRCAIYYRLKKDRVKNDIAVNNFFEALPQNEKSSQNSWNVFKKITFSPNNAFFTFWIQNLNVAASYENSREKDYFLTIIQMYAKYLQELPQIQKSEIDLLKNHLRGLGADEKRISIWLWDLELTYHVAQKEYKEAQKICEKMLEYYPEASTYSFLFEKLSNVLQTGDMHNYFLNVKDVWFSLLKDDKQKASYFKISGKFHGLNKDRNACVAALVNATEHGLSQEDKKLVMENYCNLVLAKP